MTSNANPISHLRLALLLLGALLLGACATAPAPTAPEVPAPAPVAAVAPVAAPDPAPAPEATPGTLEAEAAVERLSRARLDPLDDGFRGDLWARVRSGFGMADLDNDLVRKWEQFYAQKPDYMQRMATRGSRYLYHILGELERRNMPSDLALLPFIESAFDPQALSVARAAGMWQFMPGTGRDFELKQNLFRDDRRDILASTRAALDYLQRLYGMFNDWHLALAAYNWGQGNVQKALARNEKAGQPQDYASLRMPDETRNYVPKLQAIKNIISRPEQFGLSLPPLENHPYFITVTIQRDIDVALAARLAGLSLEQFQQLNPQLNKPVILAAGTPQVLLPYDNANRFVSGLAAHNGPLATWTAWVAPKTLKPSEAARHVGISEEQLRDVNRIPSRMLVKAGSTLLVPRTVQHTHDVSEQVADSAMLALAPEALPPRRVQFKVGRKGESVTALARRFGVPATQVAATNGVSAHGQFKAGEVVTVLVPQVARSARMAAAQAEPPAARIVRTAAPAPATRVAAAPRAPAKAAARPATHRPARQAPRTRVAMR